MSQNQLFLDTFNQVKQTYMKNYHSMSFLRQWQLEATENPFIAIFRNSEEQILKKYTVAHFRCVYCGYQWHSRIHSSILFQYNQRTQNIKWKLYGEQCPRCRQLHYNLPTYEREAVEEIMRYLIKKLSKKTHAVDLRSGDPDHPTVLYNGTEHIEDDLTCYVRDADCDINIESYEEQDN